MSNDADADHTADADADADADHADHADHDDADHVTIDAITAELEADLVALRRDIHRWPELAGDERRTAALAAERLRAAGLDVTTDVGGHGVVAVLEGGSAGPTIGYRADLDAVGPGGVIDFGSSGPVFDADFASRVPGVAHLCGHDLHTAIGVGIAETLARIRPGLAGRAVFIFQPAEETIEGARAMIEAGVLDRHRPDEIYALHCAPNPVGTLSVMPGLGLPGLDQFEIQLSGPTATADADRLAATIAAMSTVELPRTLEDYRRRFAELRRPDHPWARFVWAQSGTEVTDGRVAVGGALRAWPVDRHAELRDELRRLAESAGGRIEFPFSFPPMVCSPRLSEAAAAYLRGALGPDAVVVLRASWPFNGEDFALFLEWVPGAMFFLGVANVAAGLNGAPHTADFAADERAIGIGVRAMAGFVASRLVPGRDAGTGAR
jgi:amidohydrolase